MTQTANKQIQDIPLEQISGDVLTRFALDPPPKEMAQSIRELGITHPVLLAPAGEHYQIVCGHRRVECARTLSLPTVPAFVVEDTLAPAEMLKRNLIENHAHRTYSDIEKSGIVKKLGEAGIPEAEIIKDVLPMLDLERSKKIFNDLMECSKFSDSLQALLHSLNIPLRVCATLFRWDDASKEDVESLLSALHPGVNKCRELFEWIDETAVRDNITPHVLLTRVEIQQTLNDADLPSPKKFEAVHQQLRQWRYPVLTDLQKQVYRAIDRLRLDGRIKLRTPENFESGLFKIELQFTTREEFVAQVEQLFRITDSDALNELIQIFRDLS